MRYFILLAINTHIDCLKNSKSVFGANSKQQQGALKVCPSAFSVKFQSIIWVLSSTLMEQGLIFNLNGSPSGSQMKFCGLFGKVAHIPHTTQQDFVIGQFSKINTSHWLGHPW